MLQEKADRIRDKEISNAIASGIRYVAVPCLCGDWVCNQWGVFPISIGQGPGFTEKEAHITAQALNEAEKKGLIKGI